MLKFDKEHKKVKDHFYVGDPFTTAVVSIIGVSLTISIGLPVFAISKLNAHCKVDDEHAHLYYDPATKIERYIKSERKERDGLIRLDDYRMVTDEEAELLRFMNKHDIFRRDENVEQIKEIEKQLHDQQEFRYGYSKTKNISAPVKAGNTFTMVTYSHVDSKHSWINDNTDESLHYTGEVRDVHYMYYGYKVIHDDFGVFILEQSKLVDNLSELPPEYEYVGRTFYKAVDPKTKQELSYEDGSPSDIKLNIPDLHREEAEDTSLYLYWDDESDADLDDDGGRSK